MPDVILVRGPLSSRQSASFGTIDRVSRAKAPGVLISKPRKRMAPCSTSFCSMKSVLSLYHEVNNPDSGLPLSYSITNGTLRSGANRPVLIMVCAFCVCGFAPKCKYTNQSAIRAECKYTNHSAEGAEYDSQGQEIGRASCRKRV